MLWDDVSLPRFGGIFLLWDDVSLPRLAGIFLLWDYVSLPRLAGILRRWGTLPRWGGILPRWGGILPRWGGILPRWGVILPRLGGILPRWGVILPRWGRILPRWGVMLISVDVFKIRFRSLTFLLFLLVQFFLFGFGPAAGFQGGCEQHNDRDRELGCEARHNVRGLEKEKNISEDSRSPDVVTQM